MLEKQPSRIALLHFRLSTFVPPLALALGKSLFRSFHSSTSDLCHVIRPLLCNSLVYFGLSEFSTMARIKPEVLRRDRSVSRPVVVVAIFRVKHDRIQLCGSSKILNGATFKSSLTALVYAGKIYGLTAGIHLAKRETECAMLILHLGEHRRHDLSSHRTASKLWHPHSFSPPLEIAPARPTALLFALFKLGAILPLAFCNSGGATSTIAGTGAFQVQQEHACIAPTELLNLVRLAIAVKFIA